MSNLNFNFPEGFEISIIKNPIVQKGKGILMVHPDDILHLSSTPPVEEKERVCLWCGKNEIKAEHIRICNECFDKAR